MSEEIPTSLDDQQEEGQEHFRKPSPHNNVLDALWSLYKRIQNHAGQIEGANCLERYARLVEMSDRGYSCQFARKYMNLFMEHDYEDVRTKFLNTLEMFRLIEGDGFGR